MVLGAQAPRRGPGGTVAPRGLGERAPRTAPRVPLAPQHCAGCAARGPSKKNRLPEERWMEVEWNFGGRSSPSDRLFDVLICLPGGPD